MIVFLVFIGIITISVFVGGSINIWTSRKKNKKKQTITRYSFNQELFDADIPYNGPDFVNRFETDAWDLRN